MGVFEDLTSIVTASTGTAATLIDGTTLHNALAITPTQSFHSDHRKLSAKQLQQLRNKYKDLKAIFVDEVSMVGKPLLYQMNARLNEIFGIKDDSVIFGGIMVFAVGDLLQLPPVAAYTFFDPRPVKALGLEQCVLDLWGEFRMLELTEVMRTKGDVPWTELLHRIRVWGHIQGGDVKEQQKKDIAFLRGRTLKALGKTDDDADIRSIMHVYPTNVEVNKFNDDKTKELLAMKKEELEQMRRERKARGRSPPKDVVETTIKARTTLADPLQAKFNKGNLNALAPEKVDLCGGLLPELHLVRGMRVSLRRNVNVSDRLANGSLGTVVGWTSDKKHRGMPDYVFVDFDCPSDKIVGRATRDEFIRNQSDPDTVKTFKRFGPNVVPIAPFTTTFLSQSKKLQLKRTIHPLSVAFASTIHR